MATDRVGIEIDLMGYNEAMNQMRNLERSMKGLNGHRNRLKIQAEVDKLKMNRNALKAQKVRIQADTKNIDREITRLQNRIKQIGKGAKLFGGSAGVKYAEAAEKSIDRMKAKIKELQSLKLDMNWRAGNIQSEINQTTSAIQRMEAALRRVKTLSPGQIFSKISSSVGHMGAAMQSAGNALNRLTAPMRMLTSGMLLGAGFRAIHKVTEGLSSGFERYDIMKKFPRMMNALGYETDAAQKSIDKLDKSVRGLPTGLDHMVDMTQRFTLSLGDLERGTDVAIATNNAFLASMSTETQQYQGMMQLQDLLNGKKLNSREWMSLSSSMGAAVNEIAKVMGAKTQEDIRKFRQQLNAGKIDTEDFLDALIKVGTGEGKIAQMAQESKDTWQAFSMNIKNAFSRMSAGVIKSMDEITQVAFGKDLNQLLSENVLTGIDKMTESIKKWIKANPDKIMDFFNDLKGVDWRGLGRGFFSGFKTIASMIQSVAKQLKGKDLEKIGKAIFWIQAVASGLVIGGGLLKGGRHIIGGLGTMLVGFARGIGALGAVLGGTAVVKGLKNLKLLKNMKWLSWFTKAFKGIGGATAGAAGAAGAAGSAGGALAAGAIFKGFLPAIEIIAGIGAVVTEITGIAALNTWIIKKGINNIKEITGSIQDIISNVNKIKSTSLDKDALRNAVSTITDAYNILYGETGTSTRGANKAGTSMLGGEKGFGDMSPRKLKKSADAIGKMVEMFSGIGKVMDTIPNLVEKREGVNLDTFRNIFGGKNGLLAQFGLIAEDINKYMGKDVGITDVSASVDGMRNTFDSLTAIVKMIPQLTKSLASVMGGGAGTGNGMSVLERLREQLTGESGVFATIQSIMTSMNETLFGGGNARNGALAANSKGAGQGQGGALNSGGIGKMASAMENIKAAFDSIKGIITTMTEMQSSLAGLTTSGAQGSAITNITSQIQTLMQGVGQIVSAINTSMESAGDISTKTDGLVTAINNIKSVVSTLKGLGGKGSGLSGGNAPALGVIEKIKTMISQLGQALNTETIGALQMQVSEFKAAVDQIFETLNGDLDGVEVTVKIKGKVTGQDKLISDINKAKNDIMSAVRRIPNSITRHVYIHVNPHVNVGNFHVPTASELGGGQYRGGLITGKNGRALYRAKGGSIFGNIFKPKGTDTVPAMLTPGEYVHRKEAVDTFGVRFMQAVNRLDVAGAFRELSARMGSSVMSRRGTTIYNNITNNSSPTINQTVNTNNPNFVFKRPSRYITAL